MSNFLYDNARKLLLEGSINWAVDDIRAWLIRTNYGVETTFYTAATTDVYASTISSISNVVIAGGANGQALAGEYVTSTGTNPPAGSADADDVTFTSVGAGLIVRAYVLFKYTGNLATSPLILYVDSATGLPITANGGNIILAWDDGDNKIFRP
jgi:hypothetical protein